MRIAADANVLLSAILGGRARLVLNHPDIEQIFTTEVTLGEVQEYASVLAQERRLSRDVLLLAVAALPVLVIEREDYRGSLERARRAIGRRDPDDIELLALALHFDVPVWSNDNDFENCGVDWYTTAELLRKLGI